MAQSTPGASNVSNLARLQSEQIEQFVDASVVATMLGISVKTVYRWAGQGRIPSYKCNRPVRFLLSEVRRSMIEGRRTGTAKPL